MLEWLRGLLIDPNEASPPEGFLDQDVELLAGEFAALNDQEAHLGKRCVRYVLGGDDPTLLSRVSRFARLAYNVMGGGDPVDRPPAHQLLGRYVRSHPELLVRLGRVYQAWNRPRGEARLPEWLRALLHEASGRITYGRADVLPGEILSVADVVRLLEIGGETELCLLEEFLSSTEKDHRREGDHRKLAHLQGMGDFLVRHIDSVRNALGSGRAEDRKGLYENVLLAGVPHDLLLESTLDLAVHSAKMLREVGEAVIIEQGELFLPVLGERLENGKAGARSGAARLLGAIGGEQAREILATRLEKEKAKGVIAALKDALGRAGSQGTSVPEAPDTPELVVPEAETVELTPALSEELRAQLRALLEDFAEQNRSTLEQRQSLFSFGVPDPPTADQYRALVDFVETGAGWPEVQKLFPIRSGQRWYFDPSGMGAFLAQEGVYLAHAVRAWVMLGLLGFRFPREINLWWTWDSELLRFREARGLDFGLREVIQVLEPLGIPAHTVGRSVLGGWGRPASAFPVESLWPFYAENLELLEEAMGARPAPREAHQVLGWLYGTPMGNALTILDDFPVIPQRVLSAFWEVALGDAKTNRPAAQAQLEEREGFEVRVIEALKAGKQGVRTQAARWLGRLRHAPAADALRAAARKEKYDLPKDAMLTALEAVGESVDEFFDPAALRREAEKKLPKAARKLPPWVIPPALPRVRWAASGEEVHWTSLRWLLAQAHKLKSPEPGALLRRWVAAFEPEDARSLGRFLLESWIKVDTTTFELVDLRRMVEEDLPWYREHDPVGSEDEQRKALDEAYRKASHDSATAEKGLLAVAAACAGPEEVDLVRRYLREHYGWRAPQCKVLLRALSWFDGNEAVQLLLSVARRFRTKGIRREAEDCARSLAERRGWTFEELNDRLVPTADLDDEGRLELDYGGRTLVATLGNDLTLTLADESGKVLKSAPAPRKSDDPELGKAARKQFSRSKKDLKAVVRDQTTRLYEALCTERSWSVADWQAYLLGHPIVGRLAGRVLWECREGDGSSWSFRPEAGGELRDSAGEKRSLPDDGRVSVAHGTRMEAGEREAWSARLESEGSELLFEQLRDERFDLSDSDSTLTAWHDLTGHILEAFRLRGGAARLGYTRGQTEDGGWFYTYEKVFPSLRLKTVIQHSGNPLPEENRELALVELHFERITENQGFGWGAANNVPLGDVPEVLLSEAVADMRRLAALGSGFDPEWESRVQW